MILKSSITGIVCFAYLAAFMPCAPAHAKNADKPAEPYIDKGGCPAECCTYGHWTVTKDTGIVDAPQGKLVGTLHEKDGVEASTGEVWSWPVAVRATHAIPDTPILQGDTFYALYDGNEGNYKIWYKGKILVVDSNDVGDVKVKTEWWVKVRGANGIDGWALSDETFSGPYSCG